MAHYWGPIKFDPTNLKLRNVEITSAFASPFALKSVLTVWWTSHWSVLIFTSTLQLFSQEIKARNMSGVGFNRVFAAAMVLESVDALSDDEPKKPVEKTPKKSVPKPQAKGAGGPSGMSKSKAKKTNKGMKKPASASASVGRKEDEQEVEEGTEDEGDVIPKKPAASDDVANKGKKRPAAASKPPAKDPKKVKVCKYMYHKTNTYGFKLDKKQVMTATSQNYVIGKFLT